MSPTFDLVEAPWIPCVRADGASVELGMRHALAQAHELRELHGESPLVTAALHRLLLVVVHRVFGPRDHKEWHALRQAGRWDQARLNAYLDRWADRFDLFHPQRPFYQAPDERVKPKSVGSLVHEVASGNNPTLFDHHTDDGDFALTPPQAARMLVAGQTFGLAGLSGLPQKFTDAPCARGVLFLVQGETLFETLTLSLLPYPSDRAVPQSADDCPAWEMDRPLTLGRSVPRGYLDYLTWQSRRILFLPVATPAGTTVKQMTIAPGLRLDSAVLDPMKHYWQDEKRGPRVLRFREGRALWRDSAALFQLRAPGYRPPRAFDWLSDLVDWGYLDKSETRRYLALGMANDQAKVDFYRAERMPLPLAYLRDDELVANLDQALTMAESCSRQLWGATRTVAALLLSPDSDSESRPQPKREIVEPLMAQWAVERRYWSRLETPFSETMQALPERSKQALADWRDTVIRTAWDSFNEVADNLGHRPRALKAVVRGGAQLAAGLAKLFPRPRERPGR